MLLRGLVVLAVLSSAGAFAPPALVTSRASALVTPRAAFTGAALSLAQRPPLCCAAGVPRRVTGASVRMSGDSDSVAAEGNDDLWASLRKRVVVEDTLPTADKQSASDVVTIVLRALMANDQPSPDHGFDILLAYSSPFAKESDPTRFSSPQELRKKIEANPDAEYLVGMQDFRLVDSKEMNYAQNYIIKASIQCSDMQWRPTCFSLSRVESRWLIDDVGRAAL